MNEFISVVEELAGEVVFDEPKHALQQRVEGLLVRADHGDTKKCALQKVLIAHFGGGDFEFVADTALQALDDHALLFQASATGQVQIEERVGDDHVIRKTWNVESGT